MADAALITAAQLRLFAPRCDYLALGPALDAAAREFGILSPRELRHWLAQMHVETAGFTAFEENLNYSAERLTRVWPRRFPDLAAAQGFAHNPSALANKVYGGRLGNTAPGDGWAFRGSGCMDTTGRANFTAASAAIGVDLVANPDLLRTDRKVAARAAGAFWKIHGLNAVVAADADEKVVADAARAIDVNERDDEIAATRTINGGLIGQDARLQQLRRAATLWRD